MSLTSITTTFQSFMTEIVSRLFVSTTQNLFKPFYNVWFIESTSSLETLEAGFYQYANEAINEKEKNNNDSFVIDMNNFEQWQNIENCISFMNILNHFGKKIEI